MARRIKFRFLKSLNKLLLIFSIVAVILTLLTVLVFAVQNRFSDTEKMPIAIEMIVNVLVITLPIGLTIICVASSIIFAINLSKKSIRVQNLSAVESFSEVEILCIDKTGSLTSGELEIKKIIPLKALATEEYIAQSVSNVLQATKDDNLFVDALKKEFDLELSSAVISVLHFDGQNKYCGATFRGGKTIVIGDPEYTPIKNRIGLIKRCEEYINNGQRVLVIAEGKKEITSDGCLEELEPFALIVLKDKIRDNAFETLKWFKNNGTVIKVVSSDDAIITSVVAAEAGIDDANRYVSLEGLTIKEVKEIADRFAVFGKATPEQKEAIISALKENGYKTAMVGDDLNEVPAMKCADCSIAINNAEESAKKAADIVITNSSFSPLTALVNESRKFVYNLHRVASLCLTKTLLAFGIVLMFILTMLISGNDSRQMPFVFNHFLILDVITNGVAAFLLTFEKDDVRLDDSFIKCVFKKAIPAFILWIVSLSVIFTLYAMQEFQLINVGIYSLETLNVICVLIITLLGIVFLYNVCSPLNTFRKIVLISTVAVNAIALIVEGVVTHLTNKTDNFFKIPFLEMNGPAYMVTAVVTIALASLYIFINQVNEIKKGENEEDED